MKYKFNTVVSIDEFAKIGGVESHIYYLMKKYGRRDTAVIYLGGSEEQAERIRKYANVVKITANDSVECNYLIALMWGEIVKQVEAKMVIRVCHGDYPSLIKSGVVTPEMLEKNLKYEHIVAISKTAKNGYPDNTEVMYTPLELDECSEPILLMSATRLTVGKGLSRMKKLAQELDKAGINYLWHIYTDSPPNQIESKNVYCLPPRLDITTKMKAYDGVVQLSDSEAFPLTLNEALLSGVPLITTPLPTLKNDFEIDDRYYVELPFDMENIEEQVERIRHIKKIKKNMPKYEIPLDRWQKYFNA